MNFRYLTEYLDNDLPMLGIPGSDTVIYLDHAPVYRHSSGYDSIAAGTPVRQDGIYNLYSCTKVSLCTAATQLIERGQILPSDPVYAYLPAFGNLHVKMKDENGHTVGIRKAEKTMQIGHLLTMTSGMNYDLEMPSLRRIKETTNGRCPTVETVSAMAEEPLEFDPGEDYRYSLSLDVLGAVIEVVSGQSLGEYMKENIFDPLGMKDTGFRLPEEKKARLAAMYEYDEKSGKPVEIPVSNVFVFGSEYESGGAGLLSTVDDQILLADALAHLGLGKNGERILSPSAVNLMRTNMLNEKQLQSFWKMGLRANGYGYGYGVRTNINPAPFGRLSPVGEFGWDGARMCYMLIDPSKKLAVFHAEQMGYLHDIMQPRFCNLVYGALDI